MQLSALSKFEYLDATQRIDHGKKVSGLVAEYQRIIDIQPVATNGLLGRTNILLKRNYAWIIRFQKLQEAFLDFLEIADSAGVPKQAIQTIIAERQQVYKGKSTLGGDIYVRLTHYFNDCARMIRAEALLLRYPCEI